MLTSQSVKLFGVFVILFVMGLLLNSQVLFASSYIVLLFLLLALLLEPPGNISVKLKETNGRNFFTNDCIELNFEITVNNGIGTIACIQEHSAEFELVEGNNLRVFYKGIGKRTFNLSYKLKCIKEGVYNLPGVSWESHHLMGFRQGSEGKGEELEGIIVKSPVKGSRLSHIASCLLLNNKKNPGIQRTDFKELRDYVYDDPMGSVNWKATAARISKGINWPLVTEYEKEKNEVIWMFLDASPEMEAGTGVVSSFDYARQYIKMLSYTFLEKGFSVGICIYNNNSQLLYPNTGKKQFHRVIQQLATVMPSSLNCESLADKVNKNKRYMTKYDGLSIVFTRLDSFSAEPLINGIKMMKKTCNRNNIPLVININTLNHEIIQSNNLLEENAARMVAVLRKSIEERLKRTRVTLINWNPYEDTFHESMAKTSRK